MKRDYFEGADIAVTICAKDGTILDMNQKSRKTFLKPGHEEIIGHNVLDCHPEPARAMLDDMLSQGWDVPFVAKMVMLDVEVVEVIKSLMEDRYHSEQM